MFHLGLNAFPRGPDRTTDIHERALLCFHKGDKLMRAQSYTSSPARLTMTNREEIKRLLSKVVSPNSEKSYKVNISYEGLKRTPQFLRQALRLATSTVDEEFEVLLAQINTLETHSKKLLRLISVYQTSVNGCLENFEKVIVNMRSIVELKSGQDQQLSDKLQSSMFLRILHLQNVLENLRLSIAEIFSTVPIVLEEKVKTLLKRFSGLRDYIRKRDLALVDYDKVFDKFDTMSISKAAGNMTMKQSQHYFSTERKLKASKLEYDKFNTALKTELPCFIYFAKRLMDECFSFIFCTQVNIANQLSSDFNMLRPEFDHECMSLPVDEFCRGLVECFVEENSFKIPTFKYMEEGMPSADTSLPLCVEKSGLKVFLKTSAEPEFYEAIYNFSAQQRDDISFQKNDIITVIEKSGEWWKGSIGGNSGMFPSNYVKKLEE